MGLQNWVYAGPRKDSQLSHNMALVIGVGGKILTCVTRVSDWSHPLNTKHHQKPCLVIKGIRHMWDLGVLKMWRMGFVALRKPLHYTGSTSSWGIIPSSKCLRTRVISYKPFLDSMVYLGGCNSQG